MLIVHNNFGIHASPSEHASDIDENMCRLRKIDRDTVSKICQKAVMVLMRVGQQNGIHLLLHRSVVEPLNIRKDTFAN